MPTATNVYEEVVDITSVYLGPAAERFIDRQVSTHLNKRPDKLTQSDLSKLIDWLRLAFALLTEDSEMVNEFTKSLRTVAKRRNGSAKRVRK